MVALSLVCYVKNGQGAGIAVGDGVLRSAHASHDSRDQDGGPKRGALRQARGCRPTA